MVRLRLMSLLKWLMLRQQPSKVCVGIAEQGEKLGLEPLFFAWF